jgi:Major royal jelly protein
VAFTVGEVKDGQAVAYPNQAVNQTDPNNLTGTLDSVRSVVVDPTDRLWIVDTGRPLFAPPQPGGQKLMAVDLATDQVVQTIVFPPDVALPTS